MKYTVSIGEDDKKIYGQTKIGFSGISHSRGWKNVELSNGFSLCDVSGLPSLSFPQIRGFTPNAHLPTKTLSDSIGQQCKSISEDMPYGLGRFAKSACSSGDSISQAYEMARDKLPSLSLPSFSKSLKAAFPNQCNTFKFSNRRRLQTTDQQPTKQLNGWALRLKQASDDKAAEAAAAATSEPEMEITSEMAKEWELFRLLTRADELIEEAADGKPLDREYVREALATDQHDYINDVMRRIDDGRNED